MSKPLEPTEEQWQSIAEAIAESEACGCRGLRECGACGPTAQAVWPIIRDMVLEAAAKECEQERERWEQIAAHEAVNACTSCALFIRLLKGE